MSTDNPRFSGQALALSDVFLTPVNGSTVLPDEVSLTTQLTKNIVGKIPFFTSAMDTVTESKMAIAVARAGGVGVIHRNLTIGEQATEVDIVKRSQSGMIANPVTVSPDMTLAQVEELNSLYSSAGFPVVDKSGRLVGLITNRDKRLKPPETKVRDAMKPVRRLKTRPPGTTIEEATRFFGIPPYYEKLPLVDENGHLVGFYTWKDVEKRADYPNACLDSHNRLVVGAAIGTTGEDFLERAEALVEAGVDILVLDTKNGHYQFAFDALKLIVQRFPKLEIIPANIVTAEAVRILADLGASAAKVGQGVGSICTSTDITGVGRPQFTAVLEIAEVANKLGLPVIADGGFRSSADIVKALAAGASSVMSGRLVAGTEETPVEPLPDDATLVPYRGMGSRAAMTARLGSSPRYLQNRVAEGVEAAVPRRGPVAQVLADLMVGIRTGMSEMNSAEIRQLWDRVFFQYTGAGQEEAHYHDVMLLDDLRRRFL